MRSSPTKMPIRDTFSCFVSGPHSDRTCPNTGSAQLSTVTSVNPVGFSPQWRPDPEVSDPKDAPFRPDLRGPILGGLRKLRSSQLAQELQLLQNHRISRRYLGTVCEEYLEDLRYIIANICQLKWLQLLRWCQQGRHRPPGRSSAPPVARPSPRGRPGEQRADLRGAAMAAMAGSGEWAGWIACCFAPSY